MAFFKASNIYAMGRNNIYTMGIPEREERGTESLFKEILAENFPKLERKMGIQIFAQRFLKLMSIE